jgi:hypothetical protein
VRVLAPGRAANGTLRGVLRRRDGWWGIAFLILLLLQASMVSVPTAEDPAGYIKAFYAAHGTVIVVAQAIGALALIPFFLFARALDRRTRTSDGAERNWIMTAAALVVLAEIVTNAIPVLIVVMSNASSSAVQALTQIEDVADAFLFVSLSLFVLAATLDRPRWITAIGWTSAALMLVHAGLSLFGESALQAIAPLSFVVFFLVLTIWLLVGPMPEPERDAT